MKQFRVIFLVVAITGASLASASTGIRPPKALEALTVKSLSSTVNLMPVVGPGSRPVHTRLTVEVLSTGCTTAEDFRVSVQKMYLPTRQQALVITRTKPDDCDGIPRLIEVELATTDVDPKMALHITNPLYNDVKKVY